MGDIISVVKRAVDSKRDFDGPVVAFFRHAVDDALKNDANVTDRQKRAAATLMSQMERAAKRREADVNAVRKSNEAQKALEESELADGRVADQQRKVAEKVAAGEDATEESVQLELFRGPGREGRA